MYVDYRLNSVVFFMKKLCLYPAISFILSAPIILATILVSTSWSDDFSVGYVIGDGKGGRQFRQWTQPVAEKTVKSVTVTLRRHSGGKDTFVNLRFGRDGHTFENGRRVYLNDNSTQRVTWNVNQAPGGEPLVLNAYQGEVYLELAQVIYDQQTNSIRRPPPIRPQIPGNYQGSVNDPVIQQDAQDEREALRRCRYDRPRRPRIEITRLKPTGSLFSGKYKLEGSIYGNCIEEAGYFEYGRLKEEIEIPLDDRFTRKEFEIRVRSGNRGTIRAYTTDGKEEEIDIDQEIQAQGSYFP